MVSRHYPSVGVSTPPMITSLSLMAEYKEKENGDIPQHCYLCSCVCSYLILETVFSTCVSINHVYM